MQQTVQQEIQRQVSKQIGPCTLKFRANVADAVIQFDLSIDGYDIKYIHGDT